MVGVLRYSFLIKVGKVLLSISIVSIVCCGYYRVKYCGFFGS